MPRFDLALVVAGTNPLCDAALGELTAAGAAPAPGTTGFVRVGDRIEAWTTVEAEDHAEAVQIATTELTAAVPGLEVVSAGPRGATAPPTNDEGRPDGGP
jgi:hypothetical protein